MFLECPSCRRAIEARQPYPYHAGFSDIGFLYCDKNSDVVTWSTYDETFTKLVGDVVPWGLDEGAQRKIEGAVIDCPCGGKFRFENPLRCPFCKAVVRPRGTIYFYIIGQRIDGDREIVWRESTPPP